MFQEQYASWLSWGRAARGTSREQVPHSAGAAGTRELEFPTKGCGGRRAGELCRGAGRVPGRPPVAVPVCAVCPQGSLSLPPGRLSVWLQPDSSPLIRLAFIVDSVWGSPRGHLS